MANESQRGDLSAPIRTIQIITVALTIGPLVFLGVVLTMRAGGNAAAPPATPIITYIAIGFTIMELAVRQFVPNMVAAAVRHRLVNERRNAGPPSRYANVAAAELVDRAGDVMRICQAYLTKTIISAALVEGAAFLAIIAHFFEGETISLLLAVALIVGAALHVPSRSRVEHWVEDQIRMADQEVTLGV